MKNNKKGFTLIELLAVIVILAIIMVIAVPRILDVIDESRTSAWKNNLGMISRAIELNTSLINTGDASNKKTLSELCAGSTPTTNFATIVDLGTGVTVSCNQAKTKVSVSGGSTGQFKNKNGCIDCTGTGGSCSVASDTNACAN